MIPSRDHARPLAGRRRRASTRTILGLTVATVVARASETCCNTAVMGYAPLYTHNSHTAVKHILVIDDAHRPGGEEETWKNGQVREGVIPDVWPVRPLQCDSGPPVCSGWH